MCAGRSLITAVTPRSRQICRSSSVLTVQTWISRPALTQVPAEPGVLAQLLDPRPHDPVVADERAQHRPVVRLLDQHHHVQLGREPAHPADGVEGEAHHPRRRVRAGPPEVVERLHQPPLDQPAVARGVLGLDRQLDPAVVVRGRLQQLAQGEHLAGLRVRLGRLVVEVGPRVLPRREVQLVELGEVHRRHDAVGGRRTTHVCGRARRPGGRRRSAARRTRAPRPPRRAPSHRRPACARGCRGCCRGARRPVVGCGFHERDGCATYDACAEHGMCAHLLGGGVSGSVSASPRAPVPPDPARAGPPDGAADRPGVARAPRRTG